MRHSLLFLAALLLVLGSTRGQAQEELSDKDLEAEASAGQVAHWWTVEARMTTVFYPDIDSNAPSIPFINGAGSLQTGPPFYDTYGSKHRMLTDLEVDRDLWQGFGSVAVGLLIFSSAALSSSVVSAQPAFCRARSSGLKWRPARAA